MISLYTSRMGVSALSSRTTCIGAAGCAHVLMQRNQLQDVVKIFRHAMAVHADDAGTQGSAGKVGVAAHFAQYLEQRGENQGDIPFSIAILLYSAMWWMKGSSGKSPKR